MLVFLELSCFCLCSLLRWSVWSFLWRLCPLSQWNVAPEPKNSVKSSLLFERVAIISSIYLNLIMLFSCLNLFQTGHHLIIFRQDPDCHSHLLHHSLSHLLESGCFWRFLVFRSLDFHRLHLVRDWDALSRTVPFCSPPTSSSRRTACKCSAAQTL